MYKIFINEFPLVITSNPTDFYSGGNYRLVDEHPDELLKARETLENSSRINTDFGLMVITGNEEESFRKFTKGYQRVTAAGGVVFNDKGELLLIKRQSKWDLPKGKRDEGEEIEETAVREVEEECGLKGLVLGDFLAKSYHTYFMDGKRVLKTTHWYKMQVSDVKDMQPQLEENITELAFFPPSEINLETLDTYNSIRDILSQVL